MKPQPPRSLAPLDALDFERTDFDSAQRDLNDPPLRLALTNTDPTIAWDARRRDRVPADRALTGAAMDWLVELPPPLRPHSTCEQFPRVANAIAESWQDVPLCTSVLDCMLNDYRGGRRGFPATVQAELLALMRHQQQHQRR